MHTKNKKFKKGDKISLNWKFKERQRLLKPFIKKYKKPVLVHSTLNATIFKKILAEGKLKFPKGENLYRKQPYVEKLLGIDEGIFFSLGFVYAVDYDFKYSLLFDIGFIKYLVYYRQSISYMCYKSITDYWDEHDPNQLKKLAKINNACKVVLDRYYNEEYKGKKKKLFYFWKVEEELSKLINDDPNKRKLLTLIKNTVNEYYVKYPNSMNIAKRDCFSDRSSEIISKKPVSLLNNPHLIGFYIKGSIPKDIKSILLKQYSNKILFDGKRIISIEELNK